MENGSYYTVLEAEMSEADFINEIVNRTGCELLLDVNNVYVNAFNFKYDAEKFIQSMPLDKVKYIHMAGHYKVNDHLIIDTHGEDIIDPVYNLLAWAIEKIGKDIPVLLERDFNIPDLENLQYEIDILKLLKNEILKLQLDTEYGQ